MKITPKHKTNFLQYFIHLLQIWIFSFFLSESLSFTIDYFQLELLDWLDDYFLDNTGFILLGGLITTLGQNKIEEIRFDITRQQLVIKYFRFPFSNQAAFFKFVDVQLNLQNGKNPKLTIQRVNGNGFTLSHKKDGFQFEELEKIANIIRSRSLKNI
jgi:hypothetical protein